MSEVFTLTNIGEELELRIKQGATFDEGEFQLVYDDGSDTPIDLTNAVVVCELRKKGLDVGDPTATFTCPVLDATAGKFAMRLTASQTATIPAGERIDSKESAYVFDVFVEWTSGTNAGVKWELYHGNAFVFRRVTKA